MKKSYFPKDGIWLKGNTHTHSTKSDGQITPEALAEAYKAHGYDFLSLTDHNMLLVHDYIPDVIMITGTEHDLEYNPNKCIHVVGLAAEGRATTQYPCRRHSAQELTDQQLIDMMRDDGQFVSIAHPVWSRMEPEELLKLEGYHGIEVYNNGTEHLCHGGNAEFLWDLLLRHGKCVLATCCDDVHVAEDRFGGWVCVKAADRTYQAIVDALLRGDYYASCGPTIQDFGLEDGNVYVSCSDCREVHFVTYPPRGKSFFAEPGEALTGGSAPLTGEESYVRAVCVDAQGHCAWTNPIYMDGRNNGRM